MNQNLNSLVSRMLANAKQQQQPATTGSTTTNNKSKGKINSQKNDEIQKNFS